MDHVLGLVGKDFVLIAADMKVAHSVLTMKSDQDKCAPLNTRVVLVRFISVLFLTLPPPLPPLRLWEMDSHKVLGAGGEFADVVQFVETVRALARARTRSADLPHRFERT
jgi:20S proteasome alpha/beta subunit